MKVNRHLQRPSKSKSTIMFLNLKSLHAPLLPTKRIFKRMPARADLVERNIAVPKSRHGDFLLNKKLPKKVQAKRTLSHLRLSSCKDKSYDRYPAVGKAPLLDDFPVVGKVEFSMHGF